MPTKSQSATFSDKVRLANEEDKHTGFAFAKVPAVISKSHLRKGRITANVAVGKSSFDALFEPDGKLGHWFKIPERVLKAEKLSEGDSVDFQITLLAEQPEPDLPPSFKKLLNSSDSAQATWAQATPLAKIDWVHWIESAKQAETRRKRERDAIDMLEHGKKRVCCFDASGFYSKSLCSPDQVA